MITWNEIHPRDLLQILEVTKYVLIRRLFQILDTECVFRRSLWRRHRSRSNDVRVKPRVRRDSLYVWGDVTSLGLEPIFDGKARRYVLVPALHIFILGVFDLATLELSMSNAIIRLRIGSVPTPRRVKRQSDLILLTQALDQVIVIHLYALAHRLLARHNGSI